MQAEAAKDKAAGAIKDAAPGNAGGKLQGAAGDAKKAIGTAKQVCMRRRAVTGCDSSAECSPAFTPHENIDVGRYVEG